MAAKTCPPGVTGKRLRFQVGFVFTDFYTLPGYEFSGLEAHDACVANGAMSQLLLWFGECLPYSAALSQQPITRFLSAQRCG